MMTTIETSPYTALLLAFGLLLVFVFAAVVILTRSGERVRIEAERVKANREQVDSDLYRRWAWTRDALQFVCRMSGVTFAGRLYVDDPADHRHWMDTATDTPPETPAGAPVVHRVSGSSSPRDVKGNASESLRDKISGRFRSH